MPKLFFFLILYCILLSGAVFADIIRDSEIEEAIYEVADPVIKTSKLKDIKIYLINDDAVNAFTAGGNSIYINVGLINQFPNIDVIRGVIAHELGHILGKHVVRQAENIDNYNKLAISSIAIGLASAVSGNVALANAAVLGGLHISERSILSYSRACESSADQVAVRLLESSHKSSVGMISFFDHMEKQHRGSFVNPYDQTHPLSHERLVFLKGVYQKSHFKKSEGDQSLEYKFARSSAKLLAFTHSQPKKLLELIDPSLDKEIANYMKAICYFRISDFGKSMLFLQKLLDSNPNNPFYHELKGQILFEFGKKESIISYNEALSLRKNDLLLMLSRAIVGISIYSESPDKMAKLALDLEKIASIEKDNMTALYYLSIYYDKIGMRAKSLLNSAIIALRTDDIRRAQGLAKEAIKGFKPNSVDWYKANDIILTKE